MNVDLSAIRQGAQAIAGNTSGVYFLFYQEELVYIGQGWNCLLRVAEHTRKESVKVFTHWAYLPIESESERKAIEREFRRQYAPKYNQV